MLLAVSWPADLLPVVLALGWVVRIPLLSREEGHETITRAAWDGLSLTREQKDELIRGVRAPDVSLRGILTSALPFAQPRHALRAWSGTTVADGVAEARGFLAATHRQMRAAGDGPRRWRLIGEALHCLQDSYSPAHVERADGHIVQMRHWGPLDPLRRRGPGEEHGFPRDPRDSVWQDGQLTPEATDAVAASRSYLEMAMRQDGPTEAELAAFLEAHT